MSKEKPDFNDVWKHKENGYLARIYDIHLGYVFFYDNQDGCKYIDIMKMVHRLKISQKILFL